MQTPHVIISKFLPPETLEKYRSRWKALPYQLHDYAKLGPRIHALLPTKDISLFTAPKLINSLLQEFGLPFNPHKVEPANFDSVHMTKGMRLAEHNDNSRGRIIAISYYYHPRWTWAWGGQLQLGETLIRPAPNTLVAFPVSKDSLHRIHPIRGNHRRMAVTGWLTI